MSKTQRNVLHSFAVLTALVCGVAQAADDAPRERGVYVGLFAGAHGFGARDAFNAGGEDLHTAFFGGLRLGYDFSRAFGLELEAGVIPGRSRPSSRGALVIPYRLNALIWLPEPWIVRPFMLFGAGGMSQTSPVSLTGAELHGGLGVGIDVMRNLSVRLEARAVFVTRSPNAHWEGLAGLAYHFPCDSAPAVAAAAPMDSDADGVADTDDACPDKAGSRENKGCPVVEKDTDGDGLVDRADKCPTQAGVEENAGCPDEDKDADGIIDRLDKCPTEPGVAANAGCADKDEDGDLIVDRLDKCPKEPETRNSYQDEDGCPDAIPEALKKFAGSIDAIQFATGTAVLKPSSVGILDKAADALKKNPEVQVRISGHTDNTGDDARNQQLSQDRADAVKAHLVKKGVSDGRLTAVGEGSKKPVADNGTAQGRAKNRRVEFLLK